MVLQSVFYSAYCTCINIFLTSSTYLHHRYISGKIFILQRTASSSSLASSDANPSEIKVEASFIDFDAVTEPPVTVTVQQTQHPASDASSVQLTTSSSNDWANFDSMPEVKTNTAASNSVESLLLGLSVPASSSGPSAPVGKLSPFQSTGSQGSSFGSSVGSTALPSVVPTGGAPASSLGQLANAGGSLLTNAPTGGQWPTMNPQQQSLFPGGIDLPVSQLVTPVTGGSSSNKVCHMSVNLLSSIFDVIHGVINLSANF